MLYKPDAAWQSVSFGTGRVMKKFLTLMGVSWERARQLNIVIMHVATLEVKLFAQIAISSVRGQTTVNCITF